MKDKKLCEEIEKTVGKSIKSSKDFDWLSELVMERTGEYLSSTTLKRFWNYLREDVSPSKFTLDVLASFVGFADYDAFSERGGESQSNIVLSNRFTSDDLHPGQHVCLNWQPDRECLIEYLGKGRFKVIKAVNTKLCVDDTFYCHLFIAHEPLFIDNLIHEGSDPMVYVAGRKDGVVWKIC